MPKDDTLKQLYAIFKAELVEQTQLIINYLLTLEKIDPKKAESKDIIIKIFRHAHNIKGAARGVGVLDVESLAHHIETLFKLMQDEVLSPTKEIINLCLETIDAMRLSYEAYLLKKPLAIDLKNLLERLEKFEPESDKQKAKKSVPGPEAKINDDATKGQPITHLEELETVRVALKGLEKVYSLTEEIQTNKIRFEGLSKDLQKIWDNLQNRIISNKKSYAALQKILELDKTGTANDIYQALANALQDVTDSINFIQKDFSRQISDFSVLSKKLYEEVTILRLVPASTLLNTLPRIVRDLSLELHKEVELEMTGGEVKIDKQVLEDLRDPLIHLLRNAIDHGIEDPETRKKYGKDPIGHIQINIIEEDNQFVICVIDDGRGINSKIIAQKAIENGLYTGQELKSLPESEIIDLIFKPGFSTAKTISDVSGRGIGLDVVKANMNKLKGHVEVTTALGEGSTFKLYGPLTLTIERGLVVRSGGQLFVMPSIAVEKIFLINPELVFEVEGCHAIIDEHHTIPIANLGNVLNLKTNDTFSNGPMTAVIIKKGSSRVALLVAEVLSDQEIVIKPIGYPLLNVVSVAGITISADGQVIIVLNLNDIIKEVLENKKPIDLSADGRRGFRKTSPRVLVVDDSITTRTLEKNILENNGYEVLTAVNGQEALEIMQKEPVSLIITDIAMPVMDGYVFTEKVKKSDKYKDVPVVIVTSLGNESEKRRGLEVGADAYILKDDFESTKFLNIISQLI